MIRFSREYEDELRRQEGRPSLAEEESPKGEVRVTSPTGGQKGIKLARYDLIPPSVEKELAEHYGKGSEKYDDNNWQKGYDWKLSYRSARDHLNAFWSGEDIDGETGSKHVIAAAWHCIALAWFMDNMPQYDSRSKA